MTSRLPLIGLLSVVLEMSCLDHSPESYSKPYIVDLLTGALKYAVGK